MATNLDNNIAFISRGYPQRISREKDRLIELFAEFLGNSREAFDCFTELGIPEVDRVMIESCMDRVPVEADREVICEFLLNGQAQINAAIQRLTLSGGIGQAMQ
jgi:hypothetical protein